MNENETIEKSGQDKKASRSNSAPVQHDALKQGDYAVQDTSARKQWTNTMDGVTPTGGGNYYMNFVPVRVEKKQPNGKIVCQDVRMTREEYSTYIQQKSNSPDSTKSKVVATNTAPVKDSVVLKSSSVKTLVDEHADQQELCGSVGKGGENEPADVLMVKSRLIEIGALTEQDANDMSCFEDAIEKFQKTAGNNSPDGRIDPKGPTWLNLHGISKATYQQWLFKAAEKKPVKKAKEETKSKLPSVVPKTEALKQNGLNKTVLEVIAHNVYTAMEGLGTDEESVYFNLSKLNHDQMAISEFKSIYKAMYGRDVIDDIRGDFSDNWLFGKELTKALTYLNAEGSVPVGNGKMLTKDIKEWSEKEIKGGSVLETNQGYAQMLLDAEQKGLIHIEDGQVRETFNKIVTGDKIGNDKLKGVKSDSASFDPSQNAIPVLPLIVTMIKELIKTYGDKVFEHKFELGTFMVWNKTDTIKGRYAGELRGTQHGLGRAMDIHGIAALGTVNFDGSSAVDFVSTMLQQLPAGHFQVGLPQQGDFFPKTGVTSGNSGAANDVYKKLISTDLISLIERLKKNGRNLMVFPDAPNHLHIAVLEN